MATVSRIQTGTASLAVGVSTTTATPSSYTAGSSILFFTLNGGSFNGDAGLIRAQKTDSTTLTFERANRSDDYLVNISWVLVEFSSGVTVQDVEFTGNGSQTISTVNETKAFVVPLGMYESGQRDNSCSGRFEITSSTQVTWTAATSGQDSGCQVVEYDNCSVQEVVYTGGVSSTSWNLTVSSVTMGSSALFTSSEWDDNGAIGNREMAYMWLSSSTQVDGACSFAGYNIVPMFYLVSFTDSTTVERGLASITGTNTSTTATLSSKAVDERSVYFPNASAYPYMCGGTSADANAGDVMVDGTFTSTTQLTIERDDAGVGFSGDADISWEVINWYMGAPPVVYNAPFFGCNT